MDKEKTEKKTETAEETKPKVSKTKTEKPDDSCNIQKMNIYQKIHAVISEMGVVAKNLDVSGKYKGVSERDILDAVKKLETKYRIYSYPMSRKERGITDTAVGSKVAMRIQTVYRFVNIDKPEDYIETVTFGDGIDTLDKAPGKAMTYGDKYALMKMYKISTGDDPDQEASPEDDSEETRKNLIDWIRDHVSDEIIAAACSKVKAKNLEAMTQEELTKLARRIVDKQREGTDK